MSKKSAQMFVALGPWTKAVHTACVSEVPVEALGCKAFSYSA